jgi:ATP synthase protein I
MEEPSIIPETIPDESDSNVSTSVSTGGGSMEEFYQLRQELLLTTLVLMAIAFPFVWFFYDLNIALNYLLGACAGLVYLRLLAKNVERLGTETGFGKSQMAVFIGVMMFATQIKQLHVLPVFLGFLTFKATLIVYTLRVLFTSGTTNS